MSIPDDELKTLNHEGFFPGPQETSSSFLERVAKTRKAYQESKEDLLHPSEWEWTRLFLNDLYAFTPKNLIAFYSSRNLTPWQGAAVWVDQDGIPSIQLRKKTLFNLYSREEILAHEAVHAARAGFQESRFEEFFAYMTSEKKWRRALGPILRRPWEAWPFIACSFLGMFEPIAYLGAALWSAIGFARLLWGHATLRRASIHLREHLPSDRSVRAFLLRLTDAEIRALAQGADPKTLRDDSLRWRLLSLLQAGIANSTAFV